MDWTGLDISPVFMDGYLTAIKASYWLYALRWMGDLPGWLVSLLFSFSVSYHDLFSLDIQLRLLSTYFTY